MQIIQKIRDKGAAIVITVIALSLIGFILMDANLGFNRSADGDRTTIGKVNGQKISKDELEAKVKQIEAYYGGNVSSAQSNYIRMGAWDEVIKEKALDNELEKLGITFSPKELTSIIFSSEDAPQALKQAFTNKETNEYDVAQVQQWWSEAKKSKDEKRTIAETQVVEPIRLQALRNKYGGLIAASAYQPTWLKEKESNDAKSFATISYVSIPYISTIADSTIKVSDDDITTYMNKQKAKFQQDGGRLLTYVAFSSNASAEDTAQVLQTVSSIKDAFIADTLPQAFVSRNASSIEYRDIWVGKQQLPVLQKDTLAALPVNAVYGPYLDGSDFVLAKKIKSKILGDSIKCRHILIATADRQTGAPLLSDSVAKARIDSVELAIKSGSGFDEMEAKYSSDEAAHKDKGVMTFDLASIQNANGFSPEFAAFLLNEKGETKKVVKTGFGWHYIEIMEIKNPGPVYKIAYMAKEIVPSEETIGIANSNANKLSAEAKNMKGFYDYADKNKLQKIESSKLIAENDYAVGDALQDAREIVRWAYEAKEGQVSEPFNLKDQFVVAVLTKIVGKGLQDAKTARPQVETLVRNNKKAAIIKTKLTATPTLESAAAAYPGLSIATAGADSSLVFSSSIINGIGNEPKVIGAAFNKAYQTKASEAIEGKNGVYVIKVNGYGVKSMDTPPIDKSKMMAQQLSYAWMESLKKLADVKDERSKQY